MFVLHSRGQLPSVCLHGAHTTVSTCRDVTAVKTSCNIHPSEIGLASACPCRRWQVSLLGASSIRCWKKARHDDLTTADDLATHRTDTDENAQRRWSQSCGRATRGVGNYAVAVFTAQRRNFSRIAAGLRSVRRLGCQRQHPQPTELERLVQMADRRPCELHRIPDVRSEAAP